MSKIQMLQLLITQRLSAAAEEIFGVFGRTIAEYEEEISRSKLEIDRQRRLLDLSRKPRVSLQLSGGGEWICRSLPECPFCRSLPECEPRLPECPFPGAHTPTHFNVWNINDGCF